MHIKYTPFINHNVKLASTEPPNLEGQVVVNGSIDRKTATLTLELAEALKLFRDFKKYDIEGLAKAYGVTI